MQASQQANKPSKKHVLTNETEEHTVWWKRHECFLTDKGRSVSLHQSAEAVSQTLHPSPFYH
jgi:hypothetical protein